MTDTKKALEMAIEALKAIKVWCYEPDTDMESAIGILANETLCNIQACKEALAQPAKNIRESFNEMLEDKVAYYKGKQPAQEPSDEYNLVEILNDPVGQYPHNFMTHAEGNAFLRGLCQEAADEIERLRNRIQPAQEPVAYDKLTNDEKASIKRQINDAFNEGFEKGKDMSLVASIPPNFIRLESIDNPAPQPAQEPVDVARVQLDGYVEWREGYEDLPVGTKLYTHPAPSWQGLSDEEVWDIAQKSHEGLSPFEDTMRFARAIEQALCKRNCNDTK